MFSSKPLEVCVWIGVGLKLTHGFSRAVLLWQMAKLPPFFLIWTLGKSSDVFPSGACASEAQLLWDLLALLQGRFSFCLLFEQQFSPTGSSWGGGCSWARAVCTGWAVIVQTLKAQAKHLFLFYLSLFPSSCSFPSCLFFPFGGWFDVVIISDWHN